MKFLSQVHFRPRPRGPSIRGLWYVLRQPCFSETYPQNAYALAPHDTVIYVDVNSPAQNLRMIHSKPGFSLQIQKRSLLPQDFEQRMHSPHLG